MSTFIMGFNSIQEPILETEVQMRIRSNPCHQGAHSLAGKTNH
jgi:hypothetical protein